MDIAHLNEAQQKAVMHTEGPALLVAGAGTGKTTVITHRIAWLIENGKAKPDEILAVTFTDKASREMEERVDRLLPLGYVDLWIHTFHAFCQRILSDHALAIGLPNAFKVLDQTAAWMLVRDHLSLFDLDYYKPLGNPTKFIHALLQHFSRCKDEGVYPEEYLRYVEDRTLDADQATDREIYDGETARLREIANAYHTYQQLLLENGALDFGDLINYTVRLFETRPQILEQYRTRFRYILVDEFQDTNIAQYRLVKLLAAPQDNLMVVGDDDQSIYKFRGASFSNILTFKKDFPKAKEMYLVDNYRSGQEILDAAYRFIQQNNPDRLEVKLSRGKKKLQKKLIAHASYPGAVSLVHYRTADDEVRGVLKKIRELQEAHPDFSWNDVAILVRANEQAQRFVRAFRSLRVPHQFMAARGLYSQEIIITIISYLRLLDNYHESEALYRIVSMPVWGITHEDVVHLTHCASKKNWSLWHTLTHYQGEVELSSGAPAALQKFIALVAEHTKLAATIAPSVLIYRFLEDSGYLQVLTLDESEETREQLLYLNQFYKKVRTWEEEHLAGGVKAFVDALTMELESGDDGRLEQDIEQGPEQITISTIHAAKGLEYRYVFIVGVVHLRFPSRERRDPIEIPEALVKDILPEGDAHLQEERRLMYVALTRAKESVVLSYADDYGTMTTRKPSRFIGELGFAQDAAPETVGTEILLSTEQKKSPIRYTVPTRFSYTQIKAFETCPKQYYYAHVVRIPSAGKGVFSFGKIMHAVLEQFFQLVRERSSATQASLFGGGEATSRRAVVSGDELLGLYESEWSEDWFFDEDNKKKYYEHGKKVLKDFYESMHGVLPVPVALEQAFVVKVGDVSVKGVIDRIDELEVNSEKQWKLIDYKTGKTPKGGKLDFERKEQLLIYQIAAQEVFGKKVGALALYFLESQEQFEFVATEQELQKMRDRIIETVGAIRESDFAATPGFWCRECDFRYICPAAKQQ